MRKKNTNISRYISIVVGLAVVLVVCYVLVYLCFKDNSGIPAGDDLEKRDWLSFLGAYLSFAGTLIVSLVALLEGLSYRRRAIAENSEKRKKETQPIFSIKIKALDAVLQGYAESFSLSDPTKNKRHKNFTIEIQNVSLYPIKHVMVFDKYIIQLLKCNEPTELQCAYEDSPDYTHESKRLIRLVQSDYERAENGLPKWFNINYEDVDGNDMYQSFELHEFDGVQYYSLTKTEDV